jgi:hypothetical protein
MEVGLVLVLVVQQLGLVVLHIHRPKWDLLQVIRIHLQLALLGLRSCLHLQLELHSCLVFPRLVVLMLVVLPTYRDNHQVLAQ